MKWQPIETAPKNTLILVWLDGFEIHSGMDVRWKRCGIDLMVMREDGPSKFLLNRAITRIMGEDVLDSAYRHLEPTHWKLLPEQPETES